MKALQISELGGPDALRLTELEEPPQSHFLTPGEGVLIDVHAAGVAFPDVLQSRGKYQIRPELPYVPGAEVSGIVRRAPASSGLEPGERVAAMCVLGGYAEVTVAPAMYTFRLPDELDFAEGASLIFNYHTSLFALRVRGRAVRGEWVLVHGAAGGVGTATLQVAAALGLRTIAVVSSDDKERLAKAAGAEVVLRSDDSWKDQARMLTDGGVDIVIDPVGGDRFLDSIRCLRQGGRLVVVGFTGGTIPRVKVNRLLLTNTEIIGVGWGSFTRPRPALTRKIGAQLESMIKAGAVRPMIGARFPLARGIDALHLIDKRGAVGKVVLEVA